MFGLADSFLRSAQPIGVSVVYNSQDHATGEAFVEFSNEVDLQRWGGCFACFKFSLFPCST